MSFSNLDAKKYLDSLSHAVKETGSPYFTVAGDALPQAGHPWRRFLARMFDIYLCVTVWLVFLALVFQVNLSSRNDYFSNTLDSFAAIIIILFWEPLWLRLFGTTPGKAILGLRITTPEGKRLSYGEGLARTWRVVGRGLGYNIPVYRLVRLWKSYKVCAGNESQPWDESLSYTLKNKKGYPFAVYIGAGAVVFFLLFTAIACQQIPPNRGELSVAEFVDNYNYYAEYYGIESGNDYLNEYGKWTEKQFNGTAYIETGYSQKPEFCFTLDNGYITGVSFAVKMRNSKEWMSSYNPYMMLSSFAFAGAQKEAGLFSRVSGRISKHINDSAFQDFNFTEAGITFACDIEYSGYIDTQSELLMPDENAAETYFSLDFSMLKQ